MNSDNEIEKNLASLGWQMTPGPEFVSGVMRQIERPVEAPHRGFANQWWSPITWSLAASVLLSLGCVMLMHNRPAKPDDLARQIDSPKDPAIQLERSATSWQTVTERAVTLNGDVPAREVRQQEFERVRWVDPDHHATFERVVPHQGATLVTMESY